MTEEGKMSEKKKKRSRGKDPESQGDETMRQEDIKEEKPQETGTDAETGGKDNENPVAEDDTDKIHVTSSVRQTAADLQRQRQAELEAQQLEIAKKAAERRKQKELEHDRRLMEEKKELIRLKQGEIEESEIIPTSEENVPEKMSFWKKVGNFFYHNKWWLGIGTFFAAAAVILIVNLVTKERPDMVILFTGNDAKVAQSEAFSDYIESFCSDFNKNGEVLASVYFMPYTESIDQNYLYGNDTKITVEFNSEDAVIVVGDERFNEIVDPSNVYVDLSTIYPDNPNVDGYVFHLRGTEFADRIGFDGDKVKDDLYLAIRKPKDLLYCSEEELQETYDRDFKVFDMLIKDLS